MADESRSVDDEPRYVRDFLEGLDPNMINVLSQLGDIDDAEIEVEMIENFSKEEISNARLKAFDAAKDKAARCLHKANAGGILGPEFACEPIEGALLCKEAVSQWELVTRRKLNNFAKDTIELLSFTLDPEAIFPAKVVKDLSLNKGSFERLPEAEERAFAKLSEDIATANGNYTVDIVNRSGDKETHLITVTTSEPANEIPSVGAPDEDLSPRPSEYYPWGDIPYVPDQERISRTDDHSDNIDSDPLVELVRNFVEMSKRMLESISGRSDSSKTARQFHNEYIERMTHENTNNMRMMLKWKSEVDERLDKIEKLHKKSSAPARPPTAIDVSNGSSDNDNDNEPPYNAVSQGRNDVGKEVPNKGKGKKPPIKATTVTRKQFPARHIYETPNPRLAPKGASAARGRPVSPINEAQDPMHQSFEDANPYAPLSDESIVEQVESTAKKSPSFGRGRGRKRGNVNKPGALARNDPPKQAQSTSTRAPEKAGPSKPAPRRTTTPIIDVSSSWYDEEDEEDDAEQSMASAAGFDNSELDAEKGSPPPDQRPAERQPGQRRRRHRSAVIQPRR